MPHCRRQFLWTCYRICEGTEQIQNEINRSVSLISDTCGCKEKSFTAVLMWYQHAYQVTNYVLHKRIFKKSAS